MIDKFKAVWAGFSRKMKTAYYIGGGLLVITVLSGMVLPSVIIAIALAAFIFKSWPK